MSRVTGIAKLLTGLVLDTSAHQVEAMAHLAEFDPVDSEMDRYQHTGYQLVSLIAATSTDPDAQDKARRALTQFLLAEQLEARNENNVHDGAASVGEAQVVTRQSAALIHSWRDGC